MKDGYIKVAAGSVPVVVADVEHNKREILARMQEADALGVNLLVLPELCLTGYSCGDLFFSDALLDAAWRAAEEIVHATMTVYPIVVFGLPVRRGGRLYNCAAVAAQGQMLGLVPKTHLPGFGEFAEPRHFAPAAMLDGIVATEEGVPMGQGIVFRHRSMHSYAFGVEICRDVYAATQPAVELCLAGASIIANTSASDEIVAKADWRRMHLTACTSRLLCGYVMANAGTGESTQDVVCSAHHIIAQNGKILGENVPFDHKTLLVSEIDTARLCHDRLRDNNFEPVEPALTVWFDQALRTHELTAPVDKSPFIAKGDHGALECALQIQSHGLARRLEHTMARCAVIGISGGLDSTLALLVAVRAMNILGRPHSDIEALTMPCFGTTDRTKSNAVKLCELLGVNLREINIGAAVKQHFADIGHDENQYDVTYENAQARERTQLLMDVANQKNGLVIGTGDLSELALGWATYNGDHMSMYAVNAGVPKTIVRALVQYEAENADGRLERVLMDILDTPVSPELLPADAQGNIAQKTEDLVGPYELHDFFLYHLMRWGETPEKIFRLARIAFAGEYDDATVLHWLRVFHRRFFNQQFIRSCMPDGPKVLPISLSPRGDWHMPSDASSRLWLEQIDALATERS